MRRILFVVTTQQNMGDLALCQEWIGDLGREAYRFGFVLASGLTQFVDPADTCFVFRPWIDAGETILQVAAAFRPDAVILASNAFWGLRNQRGARFGQFPEQLYHLGLPLLSFDPFEIGFKTRVPHGDLTPVNLACEGETLTLFDFESSSYSWFTYDLASPLYSLFVHGLLHRIDGLTDKLGIFFASFMRGYVRGNILRPEAVECLPAFITFLGLLNIALFHDQKSGAHTKRIQAVVEEIALRQQLQRSIQFSSIYDEILQSVQGTSL